MLVELGTELWISEGRPYSTTTSGGERFPVTIAFNRRLTEEELKQVAGFALLIQKKGLEKEEQNAV